MSQALESLATARSNDYSALESIYRQRTGGELVRDPYASPQHSGPALTLSASVVIPAWNARDTLAACLVAIEQSSFNQRYPQRLEVIVVDDGSYDGTWELLLALRLNLRLKAVRQVHHSRAHTQNTGIAFAEGDVIISCDADMLLTPFSIEELVKRHQVFENVMLIGFRGDVDPADPRIRPDVLPQHLATIAPPFERDIRLFYKVGGWPESMCRDTDHLKRLGGGRQIWMCDGSRWNLPGMVYGALFSLRRDDFARMQGYDERFYGWGCEDTLVGVRALALGNYIMPVYSAAGLHIAHGDRSPRKAQEHAANRRVFSAILRAPFEASDARWAERARGRALDYREIAPTPAAPMLALDEALAALHIASDDADRYGKYLYALGRYPEAAAAFAHVQGTPEAEAWAHFDRGKALRAAGCPDQAAALLAEAVALLPDNPWPQIELALALAAQGSFVAARSQLDAAHAHHPDNPALAFLLHHQARRHAERAAFYARQGDHALAARDYEAALILEPLNLTFQTDRAVALAALGQAHAARAAISTSLARLASDHALNGLGEFELARLHLAMGEAGPAKVALERARRQRPRDPEISARLAAVHAAASRAYPLPIARVIVERSQAIPGWFSSDEAELLIALVVRAAASSATAPLIVEIGSYCGRATMVIALTLRGLGRDDVRLIAVDEPSLGLAPDGRPARETLRTHLAEHGLGEIVVCAPEQDAEPWTHTSHLLLIDGRHDYADVCDDVACYTPQLAPNGLVLFHDYAGYFPGVQRCVEELLLGGAFSFVAQVGTLIALARCVALKDPHE